MYNCHRWSCYLNVIILQVVGNIGKVIQRFSSLNSQVSTLVKSTLICVENSDLPYHLSKSAVQVPLSKYIWRYISMKFCFDNEDLLQNYENSWKNFNSWDHTYNQFCLNVSNSTPEMKHCIICWGLLLLLPKLTYYTISVILKCLLLILQILMYIEWLCEQQR